jgi:uncharacterized membrane protein YqaE (UPF0057 family)
VRLAATASEPEFRTRVPPPAGLSRAGPHAPSEERMAMRLIRILLTILRPRLGIPLEAGFGANILLTLLGYILRIVPALWIIVRR